MDRSGEKVARGERLPPNDLCFSCGRLTDLSGRAFLQVSYPRGRDLSRRTMAPASCKHLLAGDLILALHQATGELSSRDVPEENVV